MNPLPPPNTPEGSDTTVSFEHNPDAVHHTVVDIANRVRLMSDRHRARVNVLMHRTRVLRMIKAVLSLLLATLSGSAVAGVSLGNNSSIVLSWMTFIITLLSGVMTNFVNESKITEETYKEKQISADLSKLANKSQIYSICHDLTPSKILRISNDAELTDVGLNVLKSPIVRRVSTEV